MLRNLFKSRYTASLEERIRELKKDIADRDERIGDLLAQLAVRPALPGETQPVTAAQMAAFHAQRRKGPAALNMIQSRDFLEDRSRTETIKELSKEETAKLMKEAEAQ